MALGLQEVLSKHTPQLFEGAPNWVKDLMEYSALIMLIAAFCVSYLPNLLSDGLAVCPPMAVSFNQTKRMPTLCYFSESYWEARDKFRRAATSSNASLHELEVVPGGYTMDIAVIPGRGQGLVVHTSGVHGAEGFAGSAIQAAALHYLRSRKVKPTVVFVHAVNPYGMAHFRRSNENNVDLNRNALTPQGFEEVRRRDPNIAGYQDIARYINPVDPPTFAKAYLTLIPEVAYLVASYGLRALKNALVTGTYHEPKGVFYGGDRLQRSHVLLEGFLRDQGLLSLPRVTWIDVHTGLGKSGEDVLLVSSKKSVDEIRTSFHSSEIQSLDADQDDISGGGEGDGYSLTRGLVAHYYQPLFSNSTDKAPVVITQEFGTIAEPLVARALILENAAYHYAPESHMYWRKFTRDAFYQQTYPWKMQVAERGSAVFQQALRRSTPQTS